MKIFQLVTLESPVKLTPLAKDQLQKLTQRLSVDELEKLPDLAANFAKDSWEGLLIGLSLAKKTGESYFVDFCERELS